MDDNVTQPSRFNRSAFPHLAGFMRGYLHEDLIREHGTALRAARSFIGSASQEELMEVAGDAARFALLTAPLPLGEVRSQLRALGGAWNPQARLEIERLLRTLSSAGPPREPPEPLRRRP